MGQDILLFGTSKDVPKCKSICPQRLSPGVSIHLSSFAMSASLFRDASKGAEMRNHLVRERPLGHAEMTRMETIVLAAGVEHRACGGLHPTHWYWLGEGDDRLFLQCVQRPSGAVSGRKRGATAPHERGLCLPRMQRPVRPLRSHYQADHGREARLRSCERKHALTQLSDRRAGFPGSDPASTQRFVSRKRPAGQ